MRSRSSLPRTSASAPTARSSPPGPSARAHPACRSCSPITRSCPSSRRIRRPTAEALTALSAALEGKTPQEILRWAATEYQPGLALACSFGGPSGMVLLDMVMRRDDGIDKAVEVFYLDTDFLFPETYKLRDVCADRK